MKNPPEDKPYGSKALINACKEYKNLNGFARRMAITKEMFDQVRSRWRRLGLNRKVPSIKVFEELKSSMER